MLHVWYIYLQNWVILFGQMMVNIPAPWSIWVWWFHQMPGTSWELSNSVSSSKAVPRRHFVHRAHAGDLTGQRYRSWGPPVM